MKRRILLQAILAGTLGVHLYAAAALPVVEVYKNPSCGCCTGWVKHLEQNGFTVKVQEVANPSDYRAKFGIPNTLGSCHTAIVQGYAIEGHVPASDIKRLLAEHRKVKGLAVPSMPLGSPGMEGNRSDPYDVLLVKTDGSYSTYHHYNGK
ncbi:DUF411 domain-containing protein [Noviherbaspirillum sp.]|uniref:DUF411 domain-containing protein n=1 Tax=Noviherbaspirillum sp. TaxID=1926288 RepID=UPI002B4A1CCF|nr:DUF411 domain-containing protein [Noviherbaspirillum sp.]HJV83725.1 DUF411 domain-containing protein [Noviherbaspirillum sp.]